eukprot:3977970-Pyramimonas_sp.AAC.1
MLCRNAHTKKISHRQCQNDGVCERSAMQSPISFDSTLHAHLVSGRRRDLLHGAKVVPVAERGRSSMKKVKTHLGSRGRGRRIPSTGTAAAVGILNAAEIHPWISKCMSVPSEARTYAFINQRKEKREFSLRALRVRQKGVRRFGRSIQK